MIKLRLVLVIFAMFPIFAGEPEEPLLPETQNHEENEQRALPVRPVATRLSEPGSRTNTSTPKQLPELTRPQPAPIEAPHQVEPVIRSQPISPLTQSVEPSTEHIEQQILKLGAHNEDMKKIIARTNDPNVVKEFLQKFQQYTTLYKALVDNLDGNDQEQLEPSMVLSRLIDKLVPQIGVEQLNEILSQGIQEESFFSKITSWTSTIQAKERAAVTTTMNGFINQVNKIRLLQTLLNKQQLLFDSPKIATEDKVIFVGYKAQYETEHEALQKILTDAGIARFLSQFAARMERLQFIDFKSDLSQQVQQCKNFKAAYDAFLSMRNQIPGHTFDFIDTIINALQSQIVMESIIRENATNWRKFVSYIKQLFGLQVSTSKKVTNLSNAHLQDLQNDMVELESKQILNQSDVIRAAGVHDEIVAIQTLSLLEKKALSIEVFQTLLGWDAATQRIDDQVRATFAPDFNIDGTQAFFIAPDALTIFIKYRLLGLTNNSRTFNFEKSEQELFGLDPDHTKESAYNDAHNVSWRTRFIEQDATVDMNVKQNIKSLVVWDAQNQELVHVRLNITAGSLEVIKSGENLTKTIVAWVQEDIERINDYIAHPETIDERALGLIRSYMLMRAALTQDQSIIDEVEQIASLFNSEYTRPLIVNGIQSSVAHPFNLKMYAQQAKKMSPFFAKLNVAYAALEQLYIANVYGQQQASPVNKSTTAPFAAYVPYVAPLPTISYMPYNVTNDTGNKAAIYQATEGLLDDFHPKCLDLRTLTEVKCQKGEEKDEESQKHPSARENSNDMSHDDGYASE